MTKDKTINHLIIKEEAINNIHCVEQLRNVYNT